MAGEREYAWRCASATAALFVALDQVTKQAIVHAIPRGDHRNVFFGVDIVDVRNNGVAFGALGGAGTLVVVVTLIALACLLTFFALRASTRLLWLPVGVIAGGALGNLADRARDGAVIDFIDPKLWPAFNIADSGIVLGILGMLYILERPRAE
jgi:signal peptidase II